MAGTVSRTNREQSGLLYVCLLTLDSYLAFEWAIFSGNMRTELIQGIVQSGYIYH